MRVIGIDIGGTSIKAGLFTDEGKNIADNIFPTDRSDGEKIIRRLTEELNAFLPFDAIGISSAGQIDRESGIYKGSVNIPGLVGMSVKTSLQNYFHVPVAIANDVNAAALGENHYGAGRHFSSFLFLTYGTGIGGAIVENGEMYEGKDAFAGEFGHMITHANGRQCACGLKGCYERYASTAALVREAVSVDGSFFDGEKLFKAWHAGHPDVKALVGRWVDEVVIGLVNLVHIFNPATIIIGGGVMEQDVLVKMMQEKLDDAILPSFKEVRLVQASLGNRAGMLGAISLHL